MKYNHTEIYRLAHHYDLINDFDDDVELILEYAIKSEGKCLELGCGSGRVAIALAKENIAITGIDIGEEMLELAKTKAAKENVNVHWIKSDIVHFDLNETFDFIFCIHNTFCHIDGFEQVKTFFNQVKKHLNTDGIFMLQVFNPDFYFFTRDPNEKFPLKKYKDPFSNQMVSLSENSFYEDETQINHLKWYFKIGKKETVINWQQRVYYPQELDYIVQFCGFEIIDKFGDIDKSAFEGNPDTQILILKKMK